jgi:hypothetical protein
MKELIVFESIKDSYVQIIKDLSAEIDGELSINVDTDLDQKYNTYITKLQDAVSLLKKARDADDEIAIQAALVYIKVYTMRLSNFFEDFKNDALLLSKSTGWPEIPDNYQVPEQYNFPHK